MVNILFITHAGNDIGGGHLSRCQALADGLRSFDVKISWLLNNAAANQLCLNNEDFVFFVKDPFLKDSVPDGCFDAIVLDSYTAPLSFFYDLSRLAYLIYIDDGNDRAICPLVNMVVNYNLYAKELVYEKEHCRCLLGPSFALLRKAFWDITPFIGGGVVFISGASDIKNSALAIVDWWRSSWGDLTVVMGPLTTKEQRVQVDKRILKENKKIKLLFAPQNFEKLIAGADIVFCTSSVTAYEALAFGKKLIVFQVADILFKILRIYH